MTPLATTAPSRFDVILAFMPLAVLGGLGVAALTSVSLFVGGSVGSLFAGMAMFDGLVRNPPSEN